ncbi:unnamed protein product [Lactuca saligna]|uniref:Protein kinase domain-containing protein n=1 Tax=Lactuca saligna TaxID=75948 RepID=A0AA35YGV3_LACSI|nr:unnamed protein product [Lactuca saligna]
MQMIRLRENQVISFFLEGVPTGVVVETTCPCFGERALPCLSLSLVHALYALLKKLGSYIHLRHHRTPAVQSFLHNIFPITPASTYQMVTSKTLICTIHSCRILSLINKLFRIKPVVVLYRCNRARKTQQYYTRVLITNNPTLMKPKTKKPSNILLDDDMVAHVGGFGLAQFLGTNSKEQGASGIRGTIGYAPPVYGIGSEMTSSGDVCSFKILLLEVMTGKRPTDGIFNKGITLHKFVDMALSANASDVIDDDLLKFLQEDAIARKYTLADANKIEECLSSTVKLGESCSMESPQQQMNIKNVAHKLQHIMNMLQ